MRIEQLQLYLTVLSCGSFAAAGRLLHLSQPSVTSSLNSLEQEVGARLLERSPGQRKAVTATEAGTIFAAYAKKTMADYRAMLAALAFSDKQASTPVRIGVTSTPGSSLLPVLAGKFRESHPAIPVEVRTWRGYELVRRLKEGAFDIGVTGMRPRENGVLFDRFFYDPLVLIAPVSMKLRGPLTFRELRRLPLIVRDDTGNLMRLLIQGLKRAGLSLEEMNIVMQVSGNNDVLSSVTLGAGVGFVAQSLLAANRDNHEIAVVPVRNLHVDRYVYLLRRENAPYAGGLRLFWEYAMTPEWREGVFAFNTMRV